MGIPQKLKNNQRRIGLTGGIASGKSTITDYIKAHKKFCNICSAPEVHNCSFDFVGYQKEKLENKLVKVEKAKITAI